MNDLIFSLDVQYMDWLMECKAIYFPASNMSCIFTKRLCFTKKLLKKKNYHTAYRSSPFFGGVRVAHFLSFMCCFVLLCLSLSCVLCALSCQWLWLSIYCLYKLISIMFIQQVVRIETWHKYVIHWAGRLLFFILLRPNMYTYTGYPPRQEILHWLLYLESLLLMLHPKSHKAYLYVTIIETLHISWYKLKGTFIKKNKVNET